MSQLRVPADERRTLPTAVRERLLSIPERDRLGLIPGGRRRQLPPAVRTRLLQIPNRQAPNRRAAPRSWGPWVRRLVVDGRLAMAASAALAILVAPLVDAATAPTRTASEVLTAQVLVLGTETSSRFAAEASVYLAPFEGLPRELEASVDSTLAAAEGKFARTASRLAQALPQPLASWLGLEAHPTTSNDPGDSHVEPKH